MAQINARDWIFQVSLNPTAGTPVWASIGAVDSFTHNPSEDEESTDTTTFDSQGVAESQAMQRGASLSLDGKIKRTAGTQDPGQVAAETLGVEVGDASLGGFRFRHVDDDEWTVWTAWASVGAKGDGGNNDKSAWSCTFKRSGAATTDDVA